nr:transcription factor bHLH48-like [Ipomoea batatas]
MRQWRLVAINPRIDFNVDTLFAAETGSPIEKEDGNSLLTYDSTNPGMEPNEFTFATVPRLVWLRLVSNSKGKSIVSCSRRPLRSICMLKAYFLICMPRLVGYTKLDLCSCVCRSGRKGCCFLHCHDFGLFSIGALRGCYQHIL